MQVKDHVSIVTGASSGIGLSTAIDLSERGAKVALLARGRDGLHELARKLPDSLPVTVDMTQFERVLEAVRTCISIMAAWTGWLIMRGGVRRLPLKRSTRRFSTKFSI